MSEWRSSAEDAPRDGTLILAWYDEPRVWFGHQLVVWHRHVRRRGREEMFWSSGYHRHPDPDKWMPLPVEERRVEARKIDRSDKPKTYYSRGGRSRFV